MAFVLYPSRHFGRLADKEKNRDREQDQEKGKKRQSQSLAALAALWPGYQRSRPVSASAGITKRNSSKRKSRSKKTKNISADFTGAEMVESIRRANIQMHDPPPVEPPASKTFSRPSSYSRSLYNIQTPQDDFSSRWDRTSGSSAWSTVREDGPAARRSEDGESVASGSRTPQQRRSRISSSNGQARPWSRVSDLSEEHRSSAKLSASSISPMLDSFNNQIWPMYSENFRNSSGGAARASIVSPLSIEAPKSRQSYISATATTNRTPASDNSRSTPRSRSTGYSSGYSTVYTTSSGSSSGYMSSFYSPLSSRSSVVRSPGERALPEGHPDDKAYTLISPDTAGVFDDNPSLRRIPTFRKRLSMDESRRKPLPPDPTVQIPPPLARRDGPVQQPEKDDQSSTPSEKSMFLPPKPLPHDLDSLDDAFRRSGLFPKRRNQKQPEPERRQQADSPQYPSWRKASEDLEAQLSNLTSSALVRSSTTAPSPQPASNTDTNTAVPVQRSASERSPTEEKGQIEKPQERPRRRTFDMDSLRELRAQAAQRVNKNFRSQIMAATATKGPNNGQSNLLPMPEESQANGVSNVNPSPALGQTARQRSGPHSLTANPAMSERVNRTLSFARSRKGAERNLRLRLPRLRTTELAPQSQSDRNDLSVVVESPAELDGNSIRTTREGAESTATEKIVSALSSLDGHESLRRSPVGSLEKVTEEGPASPTRRSLVSKSIICLDAGKDRTKTDSSPTSDSSEIPVSVAKGIILRIMEKVDNLEDLFSLAVINRGFYRVLKQHELPLIKGTLYRMSPAAWELREMSPPWDNDELYLGNVDLSVPEYTAELYMRHYTRDLCTMIALKSLILVHCESFLRPDTVRALAGVDEARSAEVDDAFWRVWTFCRIFGSGKSREEDIPAQADWLSGGRLAESESRGSSMVLTHEIEVNSVLVHPPQGFSQGNGEGLTSKQLYDMMEIWTCLSVLLQVFHGKCKEARKYGVFDDLNIKPGDIAREAAAIEGWTQYLLTLGPSAILTLLSLNPSSPIESMFARAQSLGWTKWSSPTTAASGSCRWFLKEAISRVYEYRLVKCDGSSRRSSTPRTSQSSLPMSRSPSPAKSSQTSVCEDPNSNRQRQADLAAELRQKRKESLDLSMDGIDISSLMVPPSEERPISSFQEVIQKLDGMSESSTEVPPVPPVPPMPRVPDRAQARADPPLRRQSKSNIEEKISQGRHPYPTEPDRASPPPPPPQVRDPADIALSKMVGELGFNRDDAKWALKYTDTGESLDVEAAINMLLQRAGQQPYTPPEHEELGRSKTSTSGSSSDSDLLWRPTWRWA